MLVPVTPSQSGGINCHFRRQAAPVDFPETYNIGPQACQDGAHTDSPAYQWPTWGSDIARSFDHP